MGSLRNVLGVFGFISYLLIFMSSIVWIAVDISNGAYENLGSAVMSVVVPFIVLMLTFFTLKDLATVMDNGIDKKVCRVYHAVFSTFVVVGYGAALLMKFYPFIGLLVVGFSFIGKLASKRYLNKKVSSKID